MSKQDSPLESEIKKFLKRDAIIYTLFEKRCEELSEYFGNERFGLHEIFREFAMRTDGKSIIERIQKLLEYQKQVETLETTSLLEYWRHKTHKKNTSKFEEHFSINYPLLDLLRYTKLPKHHDIFRYFERDLDEPEPIGMPKKEYSQRFSAEAIRDFYGTTISFEGTYLDTPVIAPRGRMRVADGSASVVIDFSKPDQEITEYVLKIKREIQADPSIVGGLNRFVKAETLEKLPVSADEIWNALRSHKTNDGKGLSTRWADMLFIYDCERYLINDEAYAKSEIDRYWHQKNPQINFESYGSAYCLEELKDMLQVSFHNESNEIKAKYTQKTVINLAKYGLSKADKVEEIKTIIQSVWNQDNEENKYPHYAGKIRNATYKNNRTLRRNEKK
jgi:hypothetical protein